ncbi:hypothetical protein DFH07DRAFT_769360 [Mycena maculata]|uniref:Uncharacterized protein n=1 Tax=Mycena maculata TaxID=230809 RepID=A0AAD7JQ82_9AGAR|nr:hypothetical protein DFH07DRAFT_769360 [Mycena maculata]
MIGNVKDTPNRLIGWSLRMVSDGLSSNSRRDEELGPESQWNFFWNRNPHPVATLARVRCPIALIHSSEDVAYPIHYSEERLDLFYLPDIEAKIHTIDSAPYVGNVTLARGVAGIVIPAAQPRVKSPFLAVLVAVGFREGCLGDLYNGVTINLVPIPLSPATNGVEADLEICCRQRNRTGRRPYERVQESESSSNELSVERDNQGTGSREAPSCCARQTAMNERPGRKTCLSDPDLQGRRESETKRRNGSQRDSAT